MPEWLYYLICALLTFGILMFLFYGRIRFDESLIPSCRIDFNKPILSPYTFKELSADPKILVIENLLSSAEIEHILAISSNRFTRSGVVGKNGTILSDVRTSSTCMMQKGETKEIQEIEKKLCRLAGYEDANLEALQLVKYEPGEEYKPHFDYFPHNTPGSAKQIGSLGQRVLTLFIYLVSPDDGGETFFPRLDLKIKGKVGDGILWYDLNADGKENPLTEHGGLPVKQGKKIAMNVWFREPCTVPFYKDAL